MAMKVTSRHRRVKQKSVEYKGGRCQKCGYNKSLAALVFHHRDPNEKDFGISNRHCKWEQMKSELDKCDLLCSNCHHEVHEQERIFKEEKLYAEIRFLVPERLPAEVIVTACASCKRTIRRLKSQVRYGKAFCSQECSSKSQERASWPDTEELARLVWSHPMTTLSKIIGVSDRAITKRCKKLGISTPGLGYWTGKHIPD